jgi:fido (protein-threonine AMPylation protein)
MSEFDRQNKQYTREELIEQVNADAQVRAFELLETPSLVPGNFDANHLKAVHGFIFQDSSDLLPVGEYRERVPRCLST